MLDGRMHMHQELSLFGLLMRRCRGKKTIVYKDQCGERNSDNSVFINKTLARLSS